MADCSKLSVQHTTTNVLQTWDACAGVRNVDCSWWSVDEDGKWCRLMRRCSCEDTKDRMAIVLYELDASADITWTRFAARQAASDGLWESGSRDHVDQDAQQDGTRCNAAMVYLRRPADIALQYSMSDNVSLSYCQHEVLLPQTDRATPHVSRNLVSCFTTAGRSSTTSQQLIDVVELEHYGWADRHVVNSQHASTVLGVVNKLDRRRVLLTTRSTCRDKIRIVLRDSALEGTTFILKIREFH